MTMHLIDRNSGFTLIEVISVSVTIMVVFGALTVLFSAQRRTWISSEAQIEAFEIARRAVHEIGSDIRNSGNQRVPGAGAAAHVRVRDVQELDGTCTAGVNSMLVYQRPVDDNLDVIADGFQWNNESWGASNPWTVDGIIWVHRATNPNGTGSLCEGNYLVRQVFTQAQWPGIASDPPGAGVVGGAPTRVLASDVAGFAARALTGGNPVGEVAWAAGIDNWVDNVRQIELTLTTSIASLAGNKGSTQQARVRLRNIIGE